MIDLIKALLFHVSRGLFTTDTAGTKHGDLFVFFFIKIFSSPRREITKCFSLWINSVFKRAYFDLIIITRIHNHYLRIRNECIPITGFYISTYNLPGVYSFNTHSDNLFFEFHFGSVKRNITMIRIFLINSRQQRLLFQPLKHCLHICWQARDSAIDTLGCQ